MQNLVLKLFGKFSATNILYYMICHHIPHAFKLLLVDSRMCNDLPIPSNGDVMSNGTMVTYMCEDGFTLIGNRQRLCNKTTYMWNGSDPTCEGIVALLL